MTRRKPKAFSECQRCGDPIPAERQASAMYCSRACGVAVGIARAPSRAKRRVTKNCESCGVEYIAERVDARACSRECRLTLRRMSRGYVSGRCCVHCGEHIPETLRTSTKYCSLKCRTAVASSRYSKSEKGVAYRRAIQGTDEHLAWRRSNYSKNADRERSRAKNHIRRVNSASREVADRHGYEWTGPELELADRRDLTAVQVAEMLSRTVLAVQNMRAKIDRGDPRTVRLLGVPTTKEVNPDTPNASE